MSPGHYLVAITKVDAALTNNNDVRLTYTLTVTASLSEQRLRLASICYAPVTYGITMYRNCGVNRFDPFWRNFLTAIGHTEETLPKERLVFQSKEPMQKVLDDLFVGKTGWIYYLADVDRAGRCTIKWMVDGVFDKDNGQLLLAALAETTATEDHDDDADDEKVGA